MNAFRLFSALGIWAATFLSGCGGDKDSSVGSPPAGNVRKLSEAGRSPSTKPAEPLPQQRFHIGVYLYENNLLQIARETSSEYKAILDKYLSILSRHGVTAVYLGRVTRPRFDETLSVLRKHHLAVVPQLDFAYFSESWDEPAMDTYTKIAAEFILKYDKCSEILAWSVSEEIAPTGVQGLAEYYKRIRELVPHAPFFCVHNNLQSARLQPSPYPSIMGSDPYGFWWEFAGGGYLASPKAALDWTRDQARAFSLEAEKHDARFTLVVTQGGLLMPRLANAAANSGLPKDPTIAKKVSTFAAEGRMGWKEYKDEEGKSHYNVWKYYRTPRNALRTLAWIAVLENAKSFYVWSYSPVPPSLRSLSLRSLALEPKPRAQVVWWSLAGREDGSSPELEELSVASREVRSYENILMAMRKTAECPASSRDPHLSIGAFTIPGLAGRLLLLVNSDIGTWPCQGHEPFLEDDPVRVDDEGNLDGFVPFVKAREVHFSMTEASAIHDLKTSATIHPSVDNIWTVSIEPGSAALLFVGSDEEAERLRMSCSPK